MTEIPPNTHIPSFFDKDKSIAVLSTSTKQLPKEWTITTLGRVTDILMGQSPPGETYNTDGLGKPLINGPSEYGDLHPRPVQWTTAPTKLCRTQDILFCVRGNTIGRINVADQEYCIGRGVAAIQGKISQASTLFIRYWLECQKFHVYRIAVSGGSTFPNITGNQLSALHINLPPYLEQIAITHVLQTAQAAIQTRRKELALERERKAALMQELFTHGTRGEATKLTEIGEIPESWDLEVLDRCAIVQTGIAKGRKIDKKQSVELPYLRVANVQDGYLNLSEIKTIALLATEAERYKLCSGDVVVTEGGDFDKLGRGFLWKGEIPECVHQNHIFAIRAKRERLLPEYLAYLIQSHYGKTYFLSVAHKTTNLACINSTKLKAFPTLLPPLFEQQEIATILQVCDTKIAALEKEISLHEELFRALLEALMSGRLSALPLVEEQEKEGRA